MRIFDTVPVKIRRPEPCPVRLSSPLANGDIAGYNMFAYCGNDPVNNIDPTGEIAITTIILIASIVVGVICAAHTACTSYKETGKVDVVETINSGICGLLYADSLEDIDSGEYYYSKGTIIFDKKTDRLLSFDFAHSYNVMTKAGEKIVVTYTQKVSIRAYDENVVMPET